MTLTVDKKLLRTAKWLLVTGILLVASIQLTAHVVFAFASHYRDEVAQFAAGVLHRPVDIKSVHATWYGMEPIIKLRDVTVYADKQRSKVLAHVDRLSIGVDLIDSISSGYWMPGKMVIKGVKLQFNKTTKGKTQVSPMALANWLLTPGNKLLQDFNIRWKTPAGKTLVLNNLNVKIKSSSSEHRVMATSQLGKTGAKLLIWAKLHGKHEDIKGEVVFKATHLPMSALEEFLTVKGHHFEPGSLLSELWIKNTGKLTDFSHADVRGRFQNVSTHSLKNLPEVKHLSGAFSVTSQQGSLILDSVATDYDYPAVFRQPIRLQTVKGQINWHKTDLGWMVDAHQLVLGLPKGRALASFKMILPTNDASAPNIDADVKFSLDDIAQASRYYPAKVMDEDLLKWLDHALKSGSFKNGHIILRARLDDLSFKHPTGRFIASADLDNVDLHFRDKWPDIIGMAGHVVFDDRSMLIVTKKGKIFGEKFDGVSGKIDDLGNPVLQVNYRVATHLQSCLGFIQNTPLSKELGKELAPLRLKGPAKLSLHMAIPLRKHRHDLHVIGDMTLSDDTLSLPRWGLDLNNLHGRFHFTDHGMSSDVLQAEFTGNPIQIQMHSKKVAGEKLATTEVSIKGKYAASQDMSTQLSGATPFSADLKLRRIQDDRPDELTLRSDIKGLAINLPAPLHKSAEEKKPLRMRMKIFKDKPMSLFASYDNQLQVYAHYWRHQVSRAKVHFGPKEAHPQLILKRALAVDGYLPTLDISGWINAMSGSKQSYVRLPSLKKIDLKVDKLRALGQHIPNVHIKMDPKDGPKVISIQSPEVNGDVTIPKDYPHHAIKATFDHLQYIPEDITQRSNLQPNGVPPLNLTINDFWYKKLPLGRLQLSVTPEKNSLKINQFSLKSKAMSLSATGQWHAHHRLHKTTLTGAMYSHDLGKMLNLYDLTDNIEGGDGRALFTVKWEDSLVNYELHKLDGRVKLQFEDGQIVKLSKQAKAKMGIGRVLSLLSLQSLPKRLTLDFSDLTHEGFDFENLSGDFVLRHGNAFTKNAQMKGPVATVALHGRLGLKEKDYQLGLDITPHVTSSLPVVAAITGGPVAGVAAWIAEKVFTSAVNEVTTLNYVVTGPWDHPAINKKHARSKWHHAAK